MKFGNKTNNCVSNLEWTTPLENTRHARKVLNKDFGGQNKRAVKCLETGKIYLSACHAEKELNIPNSSINRVCLHRRKSIYGLHFEFCELPL